MNLTAEVSAYSGKCKKRLKYTSGTYDFNSTSGNFSGVTLERGGPDSAIKSIESEQCTDNPKRIPTGNYAFSMHNGTKWKNVPGLNTDNIGRTYILIHSGEGVFGTVGCIIVGKKFDSPGLLNKSASKQALNEIRNAVDFKLNIFGLVTINDNI